MPHNAQSQRAFPGTIRTHNHVRFALVYDHIHSVQNLFTLNRRAQIFYLQKLGHTRQNYHTEPLKSRKNKSTHSSAIAIEWILLNLINLSFLKSRATKPDF